MTRYKVTTDAGLWCETSDKEEAEQAFHVAQKRYPDDQVAFFHWYEPPAPVGHWIRDKVRYADRRSVS